jgi:hypothetical protein
VAISCITVTRRYEDEQRIGHRTMLHSVANTGLFSPDSHTSQYDRTLLGQQQARLGPGHGWERGSSWWHLIRETLLTETPLSINAPDRINNLPDIQSQVDTRNTAIDAVGIKGIRHPVTILTGAGPLPTIATLSMTVGLARTRARICRASSSSSKCKRSR